MSTEHPAPHDHWALVYESKSELVDCVVALFGRELDSNRKCLYVTSGDGQPRAIDALQETDVDVDAAMDAGDLSVRPAERVYVDGSTFDADETISLYEDLIDRAVQEGYDGLCIAAETGWIQEYDVDLDEWQECERRVNRVFRERPAIGLCPYDRSRFSADFLSDTLCAHPTVVGGSDAVSNVYYRPSSDPVVGPFEPDIDAKLQALSTHREPSRSLTDRERQLETINRTVKRINRPDHTDALRLSLETIRRSLNVEAAAIWSYEEESGRLEPLLKTSPDLAFGDGSIGSALEESFWETFTDGFPQQFERTRPPSSPKHEGDDLYGVVLPTGTHGVFLVANSFEWDVSDADIELLETVTGLVESALDRRQYEAILEDTQAELERKHERLTRLERLNHVFQRLSDVLVEATTTREIQAAACEEVTSLPAVEFARIGDVDCVTSSVDPVHTAGDSESYFDAIEDEGLPETEPTRRSAETRELQVVNDVRSDTPMKRWAREALKRGVQSVMSVPLRYDDETYGILTLYASRVNAFDDDAQDVLWRLSRLIARTMGGVERKRALVGNRLTELEFRLHSDDHAAIRLASELDCRVELEGVVPTDEDSLRVFVSVDAPSEQVLAFGAEAPVVDGIHLVTEHAGAYLYECAINDACFLETILEHNVVPRTLTAEGETAHAILDVPEEKSESEFLCVFETKYPDAELLSKRRRERGIRTRTGFRANVERTLSQRQMETLQTAYHGGYFNWPRDSSIRDLADMLDVTHPTVSRHLREAHRKVFAELFEDE